MGKPPSSASRLKDLIRAPGTLEEIVTYLASLRGLDDRAAAIVSATQLEHSLERALLQTKMVPLGNDEYGRLFGPDRPLATFNAKIRLGHALGIFERQTRRDLDRIREIRNAFAHSGLQLFFSTDEIANHCDQITLPARAADNVPVFGHEYWPPTDARGRYIETAFAYWAIFMNLASGESSDWPLD